MSMRTHYCGLVTEAPFTQWSKTINAITGATITSRAVTDGVNTAAAYVATLG